MRVSNSQKALFIQCGRKYRYRYVDKLRPKDKGNALYLGSAFDAATDILVHQKDLQAAKDKFTDLWMAHEQNLSCKFSKTDLDVRIYESSDLSKLTASAGNLNNSKAKQGFEKDGDIVKLIKEIKKMKEMSFTRDLTLEEERFLHYANVLSMLRKGYLMLESFYKNILPKITEVVGTQVKVDVANGLGDDIIGYIDLLCKMEGHQLPNGRVLTKDDLVVADVKSAGAFYWSKLDDLNSSDQLDLYSSSPQVQSISPTNLICYLAVSKQVSKDEKSFCKSCGNEKNSSHKTCNAEIDSKRCGGEWNEQVTYFCESKIVIGERNMQEAAKVFEDFDMTVRGIQAGVFVRNRDSCHAFGGVCEYYNICSKSYCSPEQEQAELDEWRRLHGE